jgi:hypothetical protein
MEYRPVNLVEALHFEAPSCRMDWTNRYPEDGILLENPGHHEKSILIELSRQSELQPFSKVRMVEIPFAEATENQQGS